MVIRTGIRTFTQKSQAIFGDVGSHKPVKVTKKEQRSDAPLFFFGDPYGNRTHVTAVKGPCLNRLTNGPYSQNADKIRILYGSGNWT